LVLAAFHNMGDAMGHAEGLARRSFGLAAGLQREGVGRSAGLEMRAMAVEFPVVHGHPNRLPFEGVLTLVDVPSDKAPSGSRGHRVVLTREAAEAALPSLLGMAVDYKAGWDGHDARQKCGIITAAEIDGRKVTVAGYLFARDYPEFGPEMEGKIQNDGLMGMSYELADAHERSVQRVKGFVGAVGGILTLFHLAIDYFRR
jgi:hypothetical protein